MSNWKGIDLPAHAEGTVRPTDGDGRVVVVCRDGTANEFSKDNTNVVRLYSTLRADRARQVAYYHPGLGTMEAAGALTSWGHWVTKQVGAIASQPT